MRGGTGVFAGTMHATRSQADGSAAQTATGGARGRRGAPAALRGAVTCLVVLGLVKATAAIYGVQVALTGAVWPGAGDAFRAAAAGHPVAVGLGTLLWYGANAALAFATAHGLARRAQWAQWVAPIYGGLHAFGFAGLWFLGHIVLLNGVLGILIAVLAMLAGSGGALAPDGRAAARGRPANRTA